MNIEIFRQVSDTERHGWQFLIYTDRADMIIRLDMYKIECKPTPRHGYSITGYWNNLFQRRSTIKERPEVPPDVEAELRTKIKELIDKAEIK